MKILGQILWEMHVMDIFLLFSNNLEPSGWYPHTYVYVS